MLVGSWIRWWWVNFDDTVHVGCMGSPNLRSLDLPKVTSTLERKVGIVKSKESFS